MLKPVRVYFNQVRYRIINHRDHNIPKEWAKDGKKYGLITYYPRHKDHVDPPITPSKLFLVERVKPFKGNPWWDKDILIELGLDSEKKVKHETIVKNTPEICAKLWKIKHLIKVTPIELPEKLPDEKSVSTYLHEHGKLMMFPKIDEKRYKATEEFKNNPKRLDGDTLSEKLRLKWLNAME